MSYLAIGCCADLWCVSGLRFFRFPHINRSMREGDFDAFGIKAFFYRVVEVALQEKGEF